jgi:hypothetical protein
VAIVVIPTRDFIIKNFVAVEYRLKNNEDKKLSNRLCRLSKRLLSSFIFYLEKSVILLL